MESETRQAEKNEKKRELEGVAKELDSLAASIGKSLQQLSSQKRFVKDLRSSLEKSDFASILQSMRKSIIGDLHSAFPQSGEILKHLEELARREVEPRILAFDKEFRDSIGRLNLGLEWWFPDVITGKFPEYNVNKVIAVVVDTRDFLVSVNGKKIGGMDIQQICFKIVEENNRLFHRQYQSQRFVEILYGAYEAVCLKSRRAVGDPAHLKEVYRTILFQIQKPLFFEQPSKDNFQPYLSDEFTLDLSRYLKNDAPVARSGVKPELHPLRDPKECFFIVLPNGDQVYRGLISFAKVG